MLHVGKERIKMGRKRKLTPAEKAEKKRRRELFETVFVGGKQKRVKRRQPLIEGIPQDEFIRRNADPVWLHQNEMWENIADDQTRDDDEIDTPF